MIDVKELLGKLNSAYNLLEEGITRVDEKDKTQAEAQVKIDEDKEANKVKDQELGEREAGIAHIEDVDKVSKESANTLSLVRQEKADLQTAIEGHTANKKDDEQKQKIAWDEINSEKLMNKKQADAIKKDRDMLNENKKKFLIEQRVTKEMK